MSNLIRQQKALFLFTVSVLFVWPFGSWGAVIYNESSVKINESVEVEANSGGNYLDVNGTLKELETAPAEVRVKINNVINGLPVTDMNIIQNQVGELEKKIEYVSEDGQAQVTSEVKIQVPGSKESVAGSQQQVAGIEETTNNQQTTDDRPASSAGRQQTTDNSATEIGASSENENLLIKLSNFFSNIFQSFWNIFS